MIKNVGRGQIKKRTWKSKFLLNIYIYLYIERINSVDFSGKIRYNIFN